MMMMKRDDNAASRGKGERKSDGKKQIFLMLEEGDIRTLYGCSDASSSGDTDRLERSM
jgi:hypothetical protein